MGLACGSRSGYALLAIATGRPSTNESPATSYDYSSPISENRIIGSKYYETKLLTQFTRGSMPNHERRAGCC